MGKIAKIEEIRSSVVQLLLVPEDLESPEEGARLRTGLEGDVEGESISRPTGEGLGPDEGAGTDHAGRRCTAADRKRFAAPLLDLCPGLLASYSYPEITQMGLQIASELRLSGTAAGDLAVILMRAAGWAGRHGRGFETETLSLLTAISRLDHAIHARRDGPRKKINPEGFISWRAFTALHGMPRDVYRAYDRCGGYEARNWYVYRGVITPDRFVRTDVLGAPAALEARLLPLAQECGTWAEFLRRTGFQFGPGDHVPTGGIIPCTPAETDPSATSRRSSVPPDGS